MLSTLPAGGYGTCDEADWREPNTRLSLPSSVAVQTEPVLAPEHDRLVCGMRFRESEGSPLGNPDSFRGWLTERLNKSSDLVQVAEV